MSKHDVHHFYFCNNLITISVMHIGLTVMQSGIYFMIFSVLLQAGNSLN